LISFIVNVFYTVDAHFFTSIDNFVFLCKHFVKILLLVTLDEFSNLCSLLQRVSQLVVHHASEEPLNLTHHQVIRVFEFLVSGIEHALNFTEFDLVDSVFDHNFEYFLGQSLDHDEQEELQYFHFDSDQKAGLHGEHDHVLESGGGEQDLRPVLVAFDHLARAVDDVVQGLDESAFDLTPLEHCVAALVHLVRQRPVVQALLVLDLLQVDAGE